MTALAFWREKAGHLAGDGTTHAECHGAVATPEPASRSAGPEVAVPQHGLDRVFVNELPPSEVIGRLYMLGE